MPQKSLFFLGLIFGSITTLLGQSSSAFNERFDYNGESDSPYSVVALDSVYVVTGTSFNDSTIDRSAVFWMVNDTGGLVLETSYGVNNRSYFAANGGGLRRVEDDGFVMVGTEEDSTTFYRICLYRISDSGNFNWVQTYLPTLELTGEECLVMPDGGFLIMGQRRNQTEMIAVKTDSAGNYLWHQFYGEPGYLYHAFDMLPAPNGGAIIFSVIDTLSSGDGDLHLMEIDSLGNVIWERSYGVAGMSERGGGMLRLSDGNILIATGKPVYEGNVHNYFRNWLLKFDPVGNLLWEKTYGDSVVRSGFIAAVENDDGSIVATSGVRDSLLFVQANLVKVSPSGEFQWERVIEHFPNPLLDNQPTHMTSAIGGGYIITGWVTSGLAFPEPFKDAWLVKVDSNGCLEPGCDSLDTIIGIGDPLVPGMPAISVYPNPANGAFSIDAAPFPEGLVGLTLYDLSGRRVWSETWVKAGDSPLMVHPKSLSPGPYWLRVEAHGMRPAIAKVILTAR